jgi:hypothetical protein
VRDPLVGRREELGRIELVLSQLSGFRGAALVMRGSAGVGKSALLRVAAASARDQGMRTLTVTGVQAETRLPFAALRHLLAPLLRGERTASREAAEVIVAAASGSPQSPAIEPHWAGLAALELLSSAGPARPACLVVDDVQWIDLQSWEALAFLGRRLEREPVWLLMAAREGQVAVDRLSGAGLAEVQVGPLSADAAELLLDRVAPDLSGALRRMVIEEAGGNPLGLIELSATAGRLKPGSSMPVSLPLTARLEQTYSTVVAGLPAMTQSLVLLAALNDGSDLEEVLAAAADLTGSPVSLDTMQPALTAGLLTMDGVTVQFRHPLIRSAVQQSANVAERLAAHAALARVLPRDGDRSTWHSAAAVVGTNEALGRRLANLGARRP